MFKRKLILKILQKIKNYRRISKNISKKSKEKITKDFIKIPKEKTYNANSWYFYQLFCVYKRKILVFDYKLIKKNLEKAYIKFYRICNIKNF